MKKKITIEAHLLQPGMTLADRRYRIDSLLGNNGIMVTYKGYDTFRKKVVVIRELFPVDIVERDRLHDYHLRLLLAGVPEEKIRIVEQETDAPAELELDGTDKVFILHDLTTPQLTRQVRDGILARLEEKEAQA